MKTLIKLYFQTGKLLLLSSLSLYGQSDSLLNWPPPPPPPPGVYPELIIPYSDLAEPPLFPGCEDLGDYAEKKICAEKKMLGFVYGNLKIPKMPPEVSISGMVVVTFVIEKNGSISSVKVVRDLGHGLGAEAKRVVELINEKGIKFNPGKSGGRAQRVRYNLPVKFHIGCT